MNNEINPTFLGHCTKDSRGLGHQPFSGPLVGLRRFLIASQSRKPVSVRFAVPKNTQERLGTAPRGFLSIATPVEEQAMTSNELNAKQTERSWETLDVAASYFSVSRRTLEKLVSEGKVPSILVGRARRIDVVATEKRLMAEGVRR